jgi:hypothetical protein
MPDPLSSDVVARLKSDSTAALAAAAIARPQGQQWQRHDTYGHRRSLGPNSIDVQRSSTWGLGSVTASFVHRSGPCHHEFNVAG